MKMSEECNNCKIGKKHIANTNPITEKIISKKEAMILGAICFECKRNGVKGKKAWVLKKACRLKPSGPQFQMFDLFEGKE